MHIKLKKLLMEILNSRKQILEESYYINVTGASQEYPDLSNILEISFALQHKVLKPLENMTDEQKDIFKEKGAIDILTPDGPDAFKPIGILNFYLGGIPDNIVSEIEKNIKEQLSNLDIEVGNTKIERSGMYQQRPMNVMRIPILKNPHEHYQGPPQMNVSNDYAPMLFTRILGFKERSAQDYSFSVRELDDVLSKWLNMNDSAREGALQRHLRPTTRDTGEHGATFITGGMDYDRIMRYLNGLKMIVDWAKSHGHTHISAG